MRRIEVGVCSFPILFCIVTRPSELLQNPLASLEPYIPLVFLRFVRLLQEKNPDDDSAC